MSVELTAQQHLQFLVMLLYALLDIAMQLLNARVVVGEYRLLALAALFFGLRFKSSAAEPHVDKWCAPSRVRCFANTYALVLDLHSLVDLARVIDILRSVQALGVAS